MTSMPWFRVYSDLLTDRKIARICKRTGHPKALVIGVWVCLLALANESPDRGALLLSDDMPYTLEDIEDETGLSGEVITQLLDEFRAHGMTNGKITIEITNWTKRQFKSDNVTSRVQRYRAKRFNETLPERYETVIDSDSESDTESEAEEETKSQPSSAAVRLFGTVTGMIAIPGKLEDRGYAIETLLQIESKHGSKSVDYLKQFYQEWLDRNYSKTNIHWLDWAIAGNIPPRKPKPEKEKSFDELLADAGYN